MDNRDPNLALMSVVTNFSNGEVCGALVVTASKTVGDLAGYWHDASALATLDPATPLYTTASWLPEGEGKEGALAWGNTRLQAGRVGREYFMTRGHFHRKREKGELVVCVSGEGALVLDPSPKNWTQGMLGFLLPKRFLNLRRKHEKAVHERADHLHFAAS